MPKDDNTPEKLFTSKANKNTACGYSLLTNGNLTTAKTNMFSEEKKQKKLNNCAK